MAIAYVTSGSGDGAGTTASCSLAATASNQTAVIFLRWNSTYNFSSLTVNGSSSGVTQIGSEYNPFAGEKARIYYLYNPPTSSVTYEFITTGPGDGATIMVGIYSGASSTQADSSNSATSASATSLNLTTTVVAANCWLIGYGRANTTIAAGASTTQRNKITANILVDSNGTVGTGSQSLQITRSTSGVIGGGVISLAEAVAPSGPTTVKTWDGVTQSTGIKTYLDVALASVKTVNGAS